MKFQLYIAGCVVLGIVTVVAWLYFQSPLTGLLVLVFWIAGEVGIGWGLSRREGHSK